ncbi:MAG: glycosyltransferase family 4 protein [Thermodesulfovibrionia bacterium]|nr:glycosyltransferase family 4 protein [Thermodesulfovibrionia bacterium]
MKTAIIHDWLVTYVGSERVLEQILKLYPDADLFCLLDFLPQEERAFLSGKKVNTSFIKHLPMAQKRYRNYLPIMPFAIQRFDLSEYQLILSSSHAVAKGVRKKPGQLHICYCHTPMRYVWDLQGQYLKESGLERGLKGVLVKAVLKRIRDWDYANSKNVDYFIANSHYIKDRIKRAYGRDADVIYPPVDIDDFQVGDERENFYLAVSRMVPYKKMDIIVEAFSDMGLPLVVIGDGPDFEKVRAKAKGNIRLLGYQAGDVLKEYMKKARAFVFAAEEDFGILPVEAQACGTPVIAYGKGGAVETVIPLDEKEAAGNGGAHPTGIFFHEQTPEALIEAVEMFEANEKMFNPDEIRKNSERFSIERFIKEYKNFVESRAMEFFGV